MKQDDLDRMLAGERSIEPSPDFASRVMVSVRREAARNQAIPFPWKRLGLGLGAFAGAAAVALFAIGTEGLVRLDTGAIERSLEATAPAASMLTMSLAGSLALVRWSLRLAR